MIRKSNGETVIPLTSSKGLPETHHATKDATKHLPGHPSTDEIDNSAKVGEAQLQEGSTKHSESQDTPKDNAKPLPAHASPEKLDDSAKKVTLSYKRCPLNVVRTKTRLCFISSVQLHLLCLTLLQHESLTPTAHVEKSNCIIATVQSYVISMQCRMASLTKSPKSTFSIVI